MGVWVYGRAGGHIAVFANGGTANDTQQLNPTIEYYFQSWDLGFLLFDLRTHDRQDLPVAELLIVTGVPSPPYAATSSLRFDPF